MILVVFFTRCTTLYLSMQKNRTGSHLGTSPSQVAAPFLCLPGTSRDPAPERRRPGANIMTLRSLLWEVFCWWQEELLLDPSNTFPSQWRWSMIVKPCLFKDKMCSAQTRIGPPREERAFRSMFFPWDLLTFCTNNSAATVIFFGIYISEAWSVECG